MDYQKIYNKVIQNAKGSIRKKLKKDHEDYVYYERHHILPKCLGGDNSEENIVLLTAKEHFICHKLLANIFKDNIQIVRAFHMMSLCQKGERAYRVGAREFKNIREEYSLLISGKNHPMYSKFHSKETKERYSIDRLGSKNPNFGNTGLKNPNTGRKLSEGAREEIAKRFRGVPKTEEHRNKLRKPKSQECKNKISIANKGKIRSEEYKIWYRENCKGSMNHHYGKKQKILTCPHCNKSGGAGAFNRWHFDNCKFKNSHKETLNENKSARN